MGIDMNMSGEIFRFNINDLEIYRFIINKFTERNGIVLAHNDKNIIVKFENGEILHFKKVRTGIYYYSETNTYMKIVSIEKNCNIIATTDELQLANMELCDEVNKQLDIFNRNDNVKEKPTMNVEKCVSDVFCGTEDAYKVSNLYNGNNYVIKTKFGSVTAKLINSNEYEDYRIYRFKSISNDTICVKNPFRIGVATGKKFNSCNWSVYSINDIIIDDQIRTLVGDLTGPEREKYKFFDKNKKRGPYSPRKRPTFEDVRRSQERILPKEHNKPETTDDGDNSINLNCIKEFIKLAYEVDCGGGVYKKIDSYEDVIVGIENGIPVMKRVIRLK